MLSYASSLAHDSPAAEELSSPSIDLVQQAYDALESGMLDRLLSLLDVHVQWELYASEVVPFAGLRMGHQEVGRFFMDLRLSLEGRVLEVTEMFAAGDRVTALGFERARVSATGASYESPFCHIWSIRRGKVTQWRAFCDADSLALAFRKAG